MPFETSENIRYRTVFDLLTEKRFNPRTIYRLSKAKCKIFVKEHLIFAISLYKILHLALPTRYKTLYSTVGPYQVLSIVSDSVSDADSDDSS